MNIKSILIIFCIVSCQGIAAGVTADIAPMQKRAATVGLATSLAKSGRPEDLPPIDPSANPFKDSGLVITDQDGPKIKPVNDHDLLELLAEQLNPTGTFIMGGEPILLFGQKKIKVGDKLPLSYEGAIYNVEIVAIERISFTVALNQEKFSRPIEVNTASKPGKNP
jgi:hypothetical protein